jgi:protein-L-isoaspartate(D-aspartate) O-methyltransferase
VLEIGAGSGYMAALLGHKARQVITLEIVPELVQFARGNLQRSGAAHVSVREADGSAGVPGEAPFDVIVLSGSVAEVPPQLLEQLAIGGRLIAVVGQLPIMQAVLVTRHSERGYASAELFDTVAPRLAGFAEPTRFRF